MVAIPGLTPGGGAVVTTAERATGSSYSGNSTKPENPGEEAERSMSIIYVARSAKLGHWSSDVGLGKHTYKLGVAEPGQDPKVLAEAGWAGETDWKIVRRKDVEELDEAAALERLSRKEKMIDPNLYPKLKGSVGVFRVNQTHVENHIVVTRALAGASELGAVKPKPTDFADYLIHNATRS